MYIRAEPSIRFVGVLERGDAFRGRPPERRACFSSPVCRSWWLATCSDTVSGHPSSDHKGRAEVDNGAYRNHVLHPDELHCHGS